MLKVSGLGFRLGGLEWGLGFRLYGFLSTFSDPPLPSKTADRVYGLRFGVLRFSWLGV